MRTPDTSQVRILAAVLSVLAGALGWMLLDGSATGVEASSTATGPSIPQAAPIITGPVEALDLGDLAILRLRFPAGSRLGWHVHNDGPQLLMMEEGRGLMQERGGPVVELLPNEPVVTARGVPHWHGAAPDAGGTQWNIYDGIGVDGSVTWLEPVTDEEYEVAPGR